MNKRLVFAAVVVVALAALLAWQRHREAQMMACLQEGRFWNGPKSRCEPPPYAPIIKRALERS